MLRIAQKLWQRCQDLLPVTGFYFDRPLVLLQSDDWGRIGLRDHEGFEQLRAAGLALGERPYDLYALETAEDLTALRAVLKRHRDSSGRSLCLEMNFVLFNLDFAKMAADGFRRIYLLPLAEGLPQGWRRPGLIGSYHAGIAEGVFRPSLHGTTHFCRSAVERDLVREGDRAELLRTLWRAGTPYIHWRMPWIGYEYWDPGEPERGGFLPAEKQRELIGQAVGAFAKLFSSLPRSACAPGYRANADTHSAWAQHGIRIAQNGPGRLAPPYFDRHGLLHLSRTVEFEPAVDSAFSIEVCLRQAEACFERGIPAIISAHSINFHSTVRDFCGPSLQFLDELLTTLESRHSDLLYLHDEDLHEMVTKEAYRMRGGDLPSDGPRVRVTRKKFTWACRAQEKKA